MYINEKKIEIGQGLINRLRNADPKLVKKFADFLTSDEIKDDSNVSKIDHEGDDKLITVIDDKGQKRKFKFVKLLNYLGYKGDIKGYEIEEVINNLKKADTSNLEVVDGEDIRKAYLGSNYVSGGDLSSSCMSGSSAQEYLDIYVENPKQIKCLVLFDEKRKVMGRALIWNTDQGVKVMDRIYVCDNKYISLFKSYALENNFKNKDSGDFSVSLDKYDFYYYPYMDTFQFLDKDEGILFNYEQSKEILVLNSTQGFALGDGAVVWSNYLNEHIRGDEAMQVYYQGELDYTYNGDSMFKSIDITTDKKARKYPVHEDDTIYLSGLIFYKHDDELISDEFDKVILDNMKKLFPDNVYELVVEDYVDYYGSGEKLDELESIFMYWSKSNNTFNLLSEYDIHIKAVGKGVEQDLENPELIRVEYDSSSTITAGYHYALIPKSFIDIENTKIEDNFGEESIELDNLIFKEDSPLQIVKTPSVNREGINDDDVIVELDYRLNQTIIANTIINDYNKKYIHNTPSGDRLFKIPSLVGKKINIESKDRTSMYFKDIFTFENILRNRIKDNRIYTFEYLNTLMVEIEKCFGKQILHKTVGIVKSHEMGSFASYYEDNKFRVFPYIYDSETDKFLVQINGKFESMNRNEIYLRISPDLFKESKMITNFKYFNKIYESRKYKQMEDFFKRNNIIEDDLAYLGRGDFGTAYAIDDERVLKISSSKAEFEAAKEILQKNDKLEHIAKIYDVEEIPENSYRGKYFIIVELLEQEGDLEYKLDDLYEYNPDGLMGVDYIDTDEIEDEDMVDFINQIRNIMYECRLIGVFYPDISPDNLGYNKEGVLKAFDVQNKK